MLGYHCADCVALFAEMHAVNETDLTTEIAKVLIHASKPSEDVGVQRAHLWAIQTIAFKR